MDVMIKLIEEDADSIERRDDMCYRKRSKLLKLVKEFYCAYSSSAERYDDATRQLLYEHQTTREVSSCQESFLFSDNVPTTFEPHTPFTRLPIHAFDPEKSSTARKKGLGVDNLEVSKKGNNSNEEQKMEKILDSFVPDAQNLMGLQVSMQQMKAKLEIFNRRKIGKDVDYNKLRKELQDIENSVMQLFGINTELTKTVEGHLLTLAVIASPELDEIGKVQRIVLKI
ncbi:hypothetical protein Nepgr_032233 [Nepenthes gracilis]|uniref:NAB domain-containing protein n=1 Tax=Nepenthes gracilis TaxID=150966 RepID=A0AAD3Y7I4_NEPGR|nr:hypothetical protein Nepgr_032233 [Nepenthes gracilis]